MDFREDLAELLKTKGSREYIAYRMGKSSQTVERWALGENSPSFTEVGRLKRIVNGMLRRAVPLLSGTNGIKRK